MLPASVTACIFSQLNSHVSLTLHWNHPFQEYFYALWSRSSGYWHLGWLRKYNQAARETTKIQCEVGLNSITNLWRTFEHLALVLHYPPRELNFAKMEQVCILQEFDFTVWPKMWIKTNGKTTGITHEYVALMYIVPPSVSFKKPKKLIRVSISFIEWLTTS